MSRATPLPVSQSIAGPVKGSGAKCRRCFADDLSKCSIKRVCRLVTHRERNPALAGKPVRLGIPAEVALHPAEIQARQQGPSSVGGAAPQRRVQQALVADAPVVMQPPSRLQG